jgi:hypothetical protein
MRLTILLLAALVLVGGLTSAASAQAPCRWDGDSLVCNEAERNSADPGFDTRSRPTPWRGWPGNLGDSARDGWAMDESKFYTPDGKVCWRHGDHFHCR